MAEIVITDGFTLNPGDLRWDGLHEFGELRIYERSSPEDMLSRSRHASVILTNKTPIKDNVINACADLQLIAVTATGYNIVDIDAAAARGIPVCNVPGYGTDSVAQHTFSLILELSNHVGLNSQSVARGEWSKSPDFCYSLKPIVELSGKILGIVGYGKIGQKVAEIGRAFGMKVIYASSSRTADPMSVSMDELFRVSDIVSLHCPLTAQNQGFVNQALLESMKTGSLLINTARGQLVNEGDLADALRRSRIGGAGLDVLSAEPPPSNHPLIGLPNCIITPHNAWLSYEARKRIMDTTVSNVREALAGNPRNVVNGVKKS